jgi:hypothetical protein
MKYIILITLLILTNHGLMSQKIMVLKDGKIHRLSFHKSYDGYHSYRIKGMDVTLFIPNEKVSRIIDDQEEISKELYHEMFNMQKTNALKISISGFSGQSAFFTYEKPLSVKWHIEGGVKLHRGDNNDFPFYQAEGWGVDIGAKYIIDNPYTIKKNGSVKHKMQHVYIKPTVGYSNRKQIGFDDNEQYKIFYTGSNIGVQFVLGGRMSLDLSGGVYYFTGSGSASPMNGSFTIPILLRPDEGDFSGKDNIGTSLSVKLGFLF